MAPAVSEMTRQYLQAKGVPELLDELARDVLDRKPQNVEAFMVEWLEARRSGAPCAPAGDPAPPAPKAPAAPKPPAPGKAAPPPPGGKMPPPPPPPPSVEFLRGGDKPPASDKDAAARAALFAEIAKGTDITKGLKKVDRSQMTHKNRDPKAEAQATDFSELERRKAARQEELEKKRAQQAAAAGAAAAEKKKEGKTELVGKMWKVENHVGPSKFERVQAAVEVDMSQSVTLDGCENYQLEISGKVNMVIVSDCKNVGVIMKNDVVSGSEVTKGQKVEVMACGRLPSFSIDRCNELMLYTTKESRDVEITATASTCVNVTFDNEKEGEDPVERPVPEQFVTKIQTKDGRPQLVTVPMEHAG